MISRILGGLAAATLGFVALGPVPASAGVANVTPCGIFDNQVVAAPASVIALAKAAYLTLPKPCDAALGVSKTVNNASPQVNDPIQWVVTVHNPTGITLPDVTVKDVLPGQDTNDLLPISFVPPTAAYSFASGIWHVGAMAPGETDTLKINELVNGTNPEKNCAQGFVSAPTLQFVKAVVPPVPNPTKILPVDASLAITRDLSLIALTSPACANETPQVPSTPVPATPGPTATPVPATSPSTTLTSTPVELPNTGRQA